MILNTRLLIDAEPLEDRLKKESDAKGKNMRLLMSNSTYYGLTCMRFENTKNPMYKEFPVIEDRTLALGEVIILSDYEKSNGFAVSQLLKQSKAYRC